MSVRPTARNRSAIALLIALSLIALLGLLVAGAFGTATSIRRSGRFAQTDLTLTAAADYALASVLASSDSLALADIAIGQSRVLPVDVVGSARLQAAVSVTRLPGSVLWMLADLSSGGGDGRRRVNFVTRFPLAAFTPEAALTSRGDVQLGFGVQFRVDSTGDVDCRSTGVADVVLAPGARLRRVAGATDSVRTVTQFSAADSARYLLGATNLRRSARIAYAPGDLTVTGGSSAGVLLVEGRLRITGPFSFAGVVIARGGIEATSGGAVFRGALMSFDATAGAAGIQLQDATLIFSRCAARHALETALPPRAVRERSWAELF